MTDYLTEQEQIQQLKTWLKQYGPTIILGIVLAFIISSAWRFYQNNHYKTLAHASSVYDEMLTLRAQNNMDAATIQADKLVMHYPKSPYAQMAAFMLARDAVIKKQYPEAIKQLHWVSDHTSNHAIKQIAQIRIARILIADNKPDDALSLLQTTSDKTFLGMIDEVRGDAFVAKNDNTAARNAYALALKELPNAEVNRPLLEMKYDNLASANTKS